MLYKVRGAAMKQQSSMFSQGEDLPLFSGTPITARVEPFRPKPSPHQGRLFQALVGIGFLPPEIPSDDELDALESGNLGELEVEE
jgi:hypothetical protein